MGNLRQIKGLQLSDRGGSGVSTHAFGFTLANGSLEEILHQMNFVDIEPERDGFTIVTSSPYSTGTKQCSGFFARSNAFNIEAYR